MNVDQNGVPIETLEGRKQGFERGCPDKPCVFCVGASAVVIRYDPDTKAPIYKESWDLCQEMDMCTATCDWEVIFNAI